MIHFRTDRLPLPALLLAPLMAMVAACGTTSIVQSWDSDTVNPPPPDKLAVIVALPDALQRQEVERAIAAELRKAGSNAVMSSSIPGMRGKLSRKKAEPALKAAGVDGVVVMFLTGGGGGSSYERADYWLEYAGTSIQLDWFSPQFTDVYVVREGQGYSDQTTQVFIESSYYDVASGSPAWSFVTKNTDIEYRDVAKALSGKIVSQLRKSGQL